MSGKIRRASKMRRILVSRTLHRDRAPLLKVMLRASAARVNTVRTLFAKLEKVMDIVKRSADVELVRLERHTFLNMFLAMYTKSMVTPHMHTAHSGVPHGIP